MPFVQAGPVRLEYYESGDGPRTFVLVHGYRSSGRIWDSVQTNLAGRGYRSIAFNMRGAGASDVTDADEDYSAFNFAKDLAAAVDALGLVRFVLVGHSLGAQTVTNYVRDHVAHVDGLVLLAGGALRRPAVPPSEEQMQRWLEGLKGYPGNIDREYWDAEHTGLTEEARRGLWEDWQRVPQQRLRGVRTMPQDLEPVIRTMTVPTLVCFGDRDHTVPPGGSAECYLALPEAVRHLHVFHGVDHSPNATIPDRLSGVLARFAEHEVWPGAAK